MIAGRWRVCCDVLCLPGWGCQLFNIHTIIIHIVFLSCFVFFVICSFSTFPVLSCFILHCLVLPLLYYNVFSCIIVMSWCCAVLCCAVLYCTVLYCTVLYCAVLCCAVLCCAVLYCAVLCCAVLCCAVLCCTVLYCTVLYCTVLYCTVLYCTVLYCTVLYCTVLYCLNHVFFVNVSLNVPYAGRARQSRSQDNYLVNSMNWSLGHSVNTHVRHATIPSAIDREEQKADVEVE